jgi:hypothetical protein
MYSMTLRCAGGRTLSTYVTRSSPSKAASRSSSKPSWYGIWPRSMRRRTTRGGSTRLVLDEIVNHGLARVGKRVFGHRPAPEHLLQGFCSRVLTFFPLRACEHRGPYQLGAGGRARAPAWYGSINGAPSHRFGRGYFTVAVMYLSPGTRPSVRTPAGISQDSRLGSEADVYRWKKRTVAASVIATTAAMTVMRMECVPT